MGTKSQFRGFGAVIFVLVRSSCVGAPWTSTIVGRGPMSGSVQLMLMGGGAVEIDS